MEKKITKREMFAKVMEIEAVKADAEIMAFLTKEVELLEKKSEKRKSAFETEEGKALIEAALDFVTNATQPVTCSEVARALNLSTQKVTPILNRLVDRNNLVKVKEGKSFVYKAV